jgi:hypothetical protein
MDGSSFDRPLDLSTNHATCSSGWGRKLIQSQFGPRGCAPRVADPILVEVIGAGGVVLDREVNVKVPVGHGHVDLLEVDLRGFAQKGVLERRIDCVGRHRGRVVDEEEYRLMTLSVSRK